MHLLTKDTNNLLGYGYNQSIESDILLLDISNNDEYIWTENFVPPVKNTENEEHNVSRSGWSNKQIIIVSIVVSIVGVIILVVGGLLLRKCNKNKQSQKKVTPSSGDENGYNKENLEDSEKGIPPTDDKEMLKTPESMITKD